MKLVLTCEHGGNNIPSQYLYLFKDNPLILKSSVAFDTGSLDLYHQITKIADFHKHNEISRLFIQLNRSIHHPKLFSEYIKVLSKSEKEKIKDQYYKVYRTKIKNVLEQYLHENEQVLHLSIHTFNPYFNGQTRNCDIGILYHPKRTQEKKLAIQLKKKLLSYNPCLNIRFNYPYKGTNDTFPTCLRKVLGDNYIGIELEINQQFISHNQMDKDIKKHIYKSLKHILKQ